MNALMDRKVQGERWLENPQALLERMYIEDYLRSRGTSTRGLQALPNEQVKQLMTEACIYASLKLAEAETRARLLDELHGD